MKPWIKVVTPHEDISRGRLDEAVFAADISDVVAGRGPLEYRDAATFFRRTYPTQGLVSLLASVAGRLAGTGKGEAVIQIQTPFGGGKTHSLIALYHFIRQGRELGDSIGDILNNVGLETAPEAAVVTFVGTAADALKGRTPWGELAHQLGQYELLREHDQRRRAPGKDLLHRLLGDRPTLILMDEIAEYVVKARDFLGDVVAFYQELTEAVKVLPRCVLVVTLPSSVPYGEEGERALHELQQVFGRVETIRTPVEGEEIYEVIRRRLFEDVGDPQEIRRTAEEFFEMYRRLGDDAPRETREPNYCERIRKAYPFHPELIDVLFERWSTFPDFQRTRGVLRLLGQLVSELYQQRDSSPLILPAHVNVANPSIRGELLRHIGNQYQGVIAGDIAAGGKAKAEQIDRGMGSEYVRYGVASGLARAIFFASFSGNERRGVGVQRLRLAVLQPGLQPAIIGDALKRLEDELWYLHVENGVFQFLSQPNLNRVIVEKEEAVRPEDIDEEIGRHLEELAGDELRVILWPRDSQGIPDSKELKLVILGLEHKRQATGTKAFVRELLEKCGQTFRTYRNAVLVLAVDEGEIGSVRQNVKRLLALRAVRGDRTVWDRLNEDNRRALESKVRDVEGGIGHRLMSAYRHLAKVDEQGMRWLDLSLPTVGCRHSLARRVQEYLQTADLLLNRISPRRVLGKAMGPAEAEKSLDEIYEAFLRYPQLPLLENKEVLLNAIAQGVKERIFGVRVGDRLYYGEPISPMELGSDAVVVREPQVTTQQPLESEGRGAGDGFSKAAEERASKGAVKEPAGLYPATAHVAAETGIREYKLVASVSWDKLHYFIRGVVIPLQNDGADIALQITLEARSQSGIKQMTLKNVQETLQQIGAKVIEERS
ncbi:MAG: DUF499 domain-containing protein [Methylacidiphilales bacterium]|nr:DUF499 domain-containing protein [Candidatus Methylacidiphilales bacterium]